MGKERNAYTAKEKLAVIAYAEARGNRAAGREFSVGESSVRDWRRIKDRLKKMPRMKKADRKGQAQYPEVEEKLIEWVTDRRRRGIAVSTVEIRFFGKQIATDLNLDGFKGSPSWVYCFMRRSNFSIRRRTHIAQRLPEDFEDQLLNFQKFVIKQRKLYDFDLSQIGNADQTPMTFDLPATTTVTQRGVKNVTINSTGNEKNRFTVMLACTADGGKLSPYVVFKRKTLPKGAIWPKGIIVRCQAKGWMDDTLMMDWLKTVWSRRPGSSRRSLLVLDAFRCHKSENFKATLNEDFDSKLAIIPGGLTPILQPLDVSVNKPMKTLMRMKWNEWFAGDKHSFTPAGRMRKPELMDICQWIVDAWHDLDAKIIVRAFLKCSISNKMDGTEDDALWQDARDDALDDARADQGQDDDEDFYMPSRPTMTDEEIQQMFDESDDDEEFEGFDPCDV